MTWSTSTPAGSEDIRQGDDRLRELWSDVETILTSHGRFPIDTAAPAYQYTGDTGNTAARPTPGEGGLYADTQVEALLRDNGVSWDRIACNFPVDTQAIFYQAVAPTGWVTVSGQNDRFLYINSVSPGVAGGAFASTSSSSGGHTHSVAVNWDISGEKGVRFYGTGWGGATYLAVFGSTNAADAYSTGTSLLIAYANEVGTIAHGAGFGSSSNGAHTHTVTHTVASHKIANVVLCEKS